MLLSAEEDLQQQSLKKENPGLIYFQAKYSLDIFQGVFMSKHISILGAYRMLDTTQTEHTLSILVNEPGVLAH